MRFATASMLALFFITAAGASGATWYVDDDNAPGPGSGTPADPFAMIQYGIDAASDGDKVIVLPGTYMETLDFKGKAVKVISQAGPDNTVVDGHKGGSVVTFKNYEGRDSLVEGFTLTNGNAISGGGVYCFYSSPSIVGNNIVDNAAESGGGIYCVWDADPLIRGNLIAANSAMQWGGAICVGSDASPAIVNNIIKDNYQASGPSYLQGGGIACLHGADASVTIRNNLIIGNWARSGGGVYLRDKEKPCMANNTIYDNTAEFRGGGLFCYDSGSSPTITDSIFWNNHAGIECPEIFPDAPIPKLTYCNVKGGWPGTGNIDADPLFVKPGQGDCHLKQDPCQPGVQNPCVDTGSNYAANLGMGILTTRTDGKFDTGLVDMGFHYVPSGPEPLEVDVDEIFAAAGGTAHFTLTAGGENGSRDYVLLGSFSGTTPGILLPKKMATLPLNWDFFTSLMIPLLNTYFFQDFLGVLDPAGQGTAVLNVTPVPGAAGLSLYFAYALNGPWDFASNPVSILFVP